MHPYKLNKYRELLDHKIIDHSPLLTQKLLSDYFGGNKYNRKVEENN